MSNSKSTLEKIPLFPFSNFLRINGDMQHNSECGGIASIIAIILVLAVLIMKLVEVFQMVTIISTSQTSMNLEPPMTNVSTVQTSATNFPYMVALGYYQDPQVVSTASSSAYYMTRNGSLANNASIVTYEPITLQTCTAQHFSVIPGIEQKSSSWGLGNWQCLPLNKTWQIGGDYELSSIFKRIQFNFSCLTSSDKVDCGQYQLYTLNSFINPSDPINPSTYYISADSFLLKYQSYYEYSSKLDNYVLITDTSVLPSEKLNTTSSLQSNQIILQQVMDLSTSKATILKIQKSVRSTVYKRSFLKLLDALAFVGGIFNSILAVFFFMSLFGRYYFEMKFAEYYFNSKQARGVGFLTWIKQMVYNVLAPTPLRPDWEIMEKRNSLQTTVNKILDIFYLHKKIAYLEQSLTLLLEPHQIKGMHLVHTQTKQEADQNFRDHQLRERVIVYLSNYKQSMQVLGQFDEEEEEQNKESPLNAFMINEDMAIKKKGIVHEAEYSEKEQAQELVEQRKEVGEMLATEMMNIDLDEEQFDKESLEKDLQTDIALLFEQGEREDGDKRSILICQKLQKWLKKGLQLSNKENIISRSLIQRLTKNISGAQ